MTLDTSACAAVSEARLQQRHDRLAAIGATPRGGVNRLALTDTDANAQAMLVDWALQRGFRCSRDEIGNLYIRREGTQSGLDPVFMGSHLDTQPTGGRFDGAYGVLAGFEVLEALADLDRPTRRPVEVVAWTNEEGSRFQPGCMGSAAFTGVFPLERMLAAKDRDGITAGEALAAIGRAMPLPARPMASVRPAAYLEAHIEQGPRLEAAGATIGVVSGIQGIRRLAVSVHGEEAHAGTTPRAVRRDAVSAAVAAIAALEALLHDTDDVVRFTVGRMEVAPNSPNTVPSRVDFSIDLRHPDADTLRTLGDRIEAVACEAARSRRCTAAVTQVSHVQPTVFDDATVALVREATRLLGFPSLEMPSGAGHDAMYLSRICPTAMVFVPCLGGVSHNEAESATASDLAAGTRVLAAALVALADA
ncbi:MAG: M20 family metallo-hydrolase [Betaproteobacteria bacterium]|nr:M20 family metallo-hydrolase [Betaproteobacteria bacterium]